MMAKRMGWLAGMLRAIVALPVRIALPVAGLLAFVLPVRGDEFPAPRNTQAGSETLLTAKEALQKIKVPDGFRVSLFAGEPDVQHANRAAHILDHAELRDDGGDAGAQEERPGEPPPGQIGVEARELATRRARAHAYAFRKRRTIQALRRLSASGYATPPLNNHHPYRPRRDPCSIFPRRGTIPAS